MRTIRLRAGPVSAEYDAGSLRYLRVGAEEVVRRIMVTVRDRAWGTIQPVISNLEIVSGAASFTIGLDAVHTSDEVDFAWHGSITGDGDGTIVFAMTGAPRRRFLRNRIGICVLHPIAECTGRECAVVHSDGSSEIGQFPTLISPHQPFFDVGSISHQVMPGLNAAVSFSGDEFEMEDQRNWTDASFKTYPTPLALPHPVEVGPDDAIRQSVRFSLTGSTSQVAAPPREVHNEINIRPEQIAPMPHFTVRDLDRVLNFVELNRNRSLAATWGIDPRVHANDERTMIENLGGQAPTVHTARSFKGNVPIEISPVLVPPIRAANGWVAVSVRELALAHVKSASYNKDVPFLHELNEFEPQSVIGCASDAPLLYDAIVVKSGNEARAWVANFSDTSRTIRVKHLVMEVPPFEVRQADLGVQS